MNRLLIALLAGFHSLTLHGEDAMTEKVAPLLTKYCISCHGAEKQKGGIELHHLKTSVDACKNHRFLENMARQIETGEMPPEEKPQPSAEEKALLVQELRGTLTKLEKGEFPRHPGRTTIRRLNRNEYNNTVRYLLGVKFLPGNDFPADGAGGEGFDNVGDSLFMPPVLMEKYVNASRRVLDALMSDPAAKKRMIFAVPQGKDSPQAAARSVLTTTSLPLRTSPVKRGKWILETLLGTPPAPPPQDAGVLPADDKTPDGLSFREQLEKHRKVASCAGCHEKIDPLGFGLENFDAIGRWRTGDANGQPVESKAVLPGGLAFSSPAELKVQLLKSRDLFGRNMCRKLLAYSLGRPLEYYDEPVIAQLFETLQRNAWQIRPVIQAITASHPFQSRAAQR